jgi:hypothetical protein
MNIMGGPTPNSGTPNNASSGDLSRQKLNTYIYDYFLKYGNHEVARIILKTVDLDLDPHQSPDRKDINGVGDSMDTDSKDNNKKPDDLPSPNVPAASDGSFLYDWWHQFWECFNAQHGRGNNTQTAKYLSNVQVCRCFFFESSHLPCPCPCPCPPPIPLTRSIRPEWPASDRG